MNIYQTPQQLPNSAYTLASMPVTTPIKVDMPLYFDQQTLRDNHVQQITFIKQTKVQL